MGLKLVNALITGLAQGSMIALVALGYTMVYGILKLINFAHSEVFMMGAYAGLFLIAAYGGEQAPLVAGVAGTLSAMVLTGLLGVLVERLAYAPLRGETSDSRLGMLAARFLGGPILSAVLWIISAMTRFRTARGKGANTR